MVEFAITAGIFLFLLLGIIEFGRAMWIKNSITAGARDGARFAAVRGANSGSPTDSAGVAAYVKSKIPISPLTVRPRWPSTTKNPGDPVQVIVEFAYAPLIAIPLNRTLSSSARMIILY
jgi:Flp pilus assembly protein TadG